MGKNFALIGAAGFVAPRHFKAIKETNNQLVAILDRSDSVGIIDRYFPDAALFLESERFDRHLYKLSKKVTVKKLIMYQYVHLITFMMHILD